MTTIETVAGHEVEFRYFSRSPKAMPDDSERSHVRNLIEDGYISGELNLSVYCDHREYEFAGWWKIL